MDERIKLICADIPELQLDAIVNSANKSLTGGGGVDGAIHKKAGKELMNACQALRGCETGFSKITPGYNLPAKYIIHTVGPVWYGGYKNEEFLLKSCYNETLKLCIENNITSIAFPSISTGAYKFPFEKAGLIAIKTINHFLKKNIPIEKVLLVSYTESELKRHQRIFKRLDKHETRNRIL